MSITNINEKLYTSVSSNAFSIVFCYDSDSAEIPLDKVRFSKREKGRGHQCKQGKSK